MALLVTPINLPLVLRCPKGPDRLIVVAHNQGIFVGGNKMSEDTSILGNDELMKKPIDELTPEQLKQFLDEVVDGQKKEIDELLKERLWLRFIYGCLSHTKMLESYRNNGLDQGNMFPVWLICYLLKTDEVEGR